MPAFLADRRVQLALGIVVVLIVVGAVVATRSSSGSGPESDAGASSTVTSVDASTTSAPSATSPTSTAAVSPGASTTVTPTSTPHDPHFPLADLPLTVTETRTTGLKDGDKVSFHIVPTSGSQAYGVSIRLCAADATFPALDDFEPATAGKCIGHALSADSDVLVETAGSPPYQGLDAEFRVGVGTDTYTMTDGTPVSISCGPANPCQLVLLLQVPNAFGFKTYPVTFG